ncbi:hypothetical protein J437_LFUL009620, partial [Ladona fulva]
SPQDCPIQNTQCIDGKCQCTGDYGPNKANEKCLPNKLGGPCVNNDDCSLITNAVCTKGSCVCKSGFTEKKGTCSMGSIATLAMSAILFAVTSRFLL